MFRYKSVSEYSHLCPKDSMPSFHQEVFQYLWNIIKQSKLCCCVSKFYCSTSKTLESCPEGCCGKCLIVISVDENIESSMLTWILDQQIQMKTLKMKLQKTRIQSIVVNPKIISDSIVSNIG